MRDAIGRDVGSTVGVMISALIACAACHQASTVVAQHEPAEVVRAESTPSASSCKPEPPISIELTSRALADGRHEIVARATPTAAVASVELALIVPSGGVLDRVGRASFGPTATGVVRTLTATLATTERTSTISAIARIPIEGVSMSRATSLTLGEVKVPHTIVYALPDGERAREVRP